MTACGDVWVLQAGCLPEDAPLNVEILDPEEYLQLPPLLCRVLTTSYGYVRITNTVLRRILRRQLLRILRRCTPEQMHACTSRLSSSGIYSMHSQG